MGVLGVQFLVSAMSWDRLPRNLDMTTGGLCRLVVDIFRECYHRTQSAYYNTHSEDIRRMKLSQIIVQVSNQAIAGACSNVCGGPAPASTRRLNARQAPTAQNMPNLTPKYSSSGELERFSCPTAPKWTLFTPKAIVITLNQPHFHSEPHLLRHATGKLSGPVLPALDNPDPP